MSSTPATKGFSSLPAELKREIFTHVLRDEDCRRVEYVTQYTGRPTNPNFRVTGVNLTTRQGPLTAEIAQVDRTTRDIYAKLCAEKTQSFYKLDIQCHHIADVVAMWEQNEVPFHAIRHLHLNVDVRGYSAHNQGSNAPYDTRVQPVIIDLLNMVKNRFRNLMSIDIRSMLQSGFVAQDQAIRETAMGRSVSMLMDLPKLISIQRTFAIYDFLTAFGPTKVWKADCTCGVANLDIWASVQWKFITTNDWQARLA